MELSRANVLAFGLSSLALAGASLAAGFTPGNIVVTRAVGGSGAYDPLTNTMTTPTALTGSGTAATVIVEEYTPAFTLVQRIVMPNTQVLPATGGNRALTLSGTQQFEGHITLSGDGSKLIVGGYNQTAGVAGTNAATSATVERVVGVIDVASGGVNTTTALTDVASGQSFRSAYSPNGTDLYANGASGALVGSKVTGGVNYATLGSTTSTNLSPSETNLRALNGFNNQLYVANNAAVSGSAAASAGGVYTVGSGFPTAGPVTPTALPGFATTGLATPNPGNTKPDDFFFANSTTLYVTDSRNGNATDTVNGTNAGGLTKWVFSDTNGDTTLDTWVFQYELKFGNSLGTNTALYVGAHGLSGLVDPISGQVNLYLTTLDAGASRNELIRVTDALGGLASNGGFFTEAASLLSPDQVGGFQTAFRGVEVVIPEPTALAAIGLTTAGLLRRRRA